MAEYNDYNSSLTAEDIESTLNGAVVHNKAMKLSDAQKAQARDNIGAGSADNSFVVLGYFATLEELIATVPEPKAGPFYGVGETEPYDFYSWDELHSVWKNNGPIKGADGKDGSDANVTKENIEAALGYTPADAENVGVPDGSIGTDKLANGAVTAEKLDPNIDLGGLSMVKLWENASPTSEFAAQTVALDLSKYNAALIIYRRATTANEAYSAFIRVGDSGSLFAMTNYRSDRTATVSRTGVVFNAGRQASLSESLSENNVASVPITIYGIKGVS